MTAVRKTLLTAVLLLAAATPAAAAPALRDALLVGENHDQFVDDLYVANDGRTLVASRPSVVDGRRSDHMAISPDGTRLAVSASTASVVHILDTATGKRIGVFPAGHSPHENTYTQDGSRIFHPSIGRAYLPTA